jgi:hypothetical protein
MRHDRQLGIEPAVSPGTVTVSMVVIGFDLVLLPSTISGDS